MFEHLLDPQFDDLAEASATVVLEGQSNTAAWLESMGVKPPPAPDTTDVARQAFAALTNPSVSDEDKKRALLGMKTPASVQHATAMLNGYDWDYVNKAKEIRGYVVAKLMEESTHPDARIRMRALQLLGTLTEVGSFTERVEVTKKNASDDEVLDRLRSKLAALLPKTVEVQDAVIKNG